MSYKHNIHQPVLSEEMKKELFGEDAMKRLVENMKADKERKEMSIKPLSSGALSEIDASIRKYQKKEQLEKEMITNNHTTEMTIPVMITVNGVTVYTTGKINEATIKDIYENVKDDVEEVEEKTDVKSYRLKMIQTGKDTLKLEWRSYDFSEGKRGFKLDDGIVFIQLKDEHFEGFIAGEDLPLVENDKLVKHVREMMQVFIGREYDLHDEMEIVKKVVC